MRRVSCTVFQNKLSLTARLRNEKNSYCLRNLFCPYQSSVVAKISVVNQMKGIQVKRSVDLMHIGTISSNTRRVAEHKTVKCLRFNSKCSILTGKKRDPQ